MEPTLRAGDRLRVDPRAYRARRPRVDDVVVLIDPERTDRWIVKRIAAIGPGAWWWTTRGLVPRAPEASDSERPPDAIDTVRLAPEVVWVLGDNAERSRDSRQFGPMPASALVGRVFRIYAPTDRRRDL
jgi:signal peptidase I